MGFLDGLMGRIGYTRLSNGTHRYITKRAKYSADPDYMKLALENPIVYACIEIRAKILAMCEFKIQDSEGNISNSSSPVIELLNNPNSFQSKEDFLKQHEWFRCVYGWVFVRPYGGVGNPTKAIFNLNPSFVTFYEKNFVSPIAWTDSDIEAFQSQKFNYKEPQEKDSDKGKDIAYKDVVAFYDTGNAINVDKKQKNPLISPSRLCSVLKSVENSNMALDAENVMIQTNGREIFSGGANRGFNLGAALPMEEDDKESIESNLINNYGLTSLKRRSIATNQEINWQSLHIKLKDLGLHESVSSNANLIREAFEVPNELYKAFQKGSTYENQKEALISFVQSTIQPIADDIAASFTQWFELEGVKVIASFDHLPVMQHTESKKAEKVLKLATAFQRLVQSGLDGNVARVFMEQQGISFQDNGLSLETEQNNTNEENTSDE